MAQEDIVPELMSLRLQALLRGTTGFTISSFELRQTSIVTSIDTDKRAS